MDERIKPGQLHEPMIDKHDIEQKPEDFDDPRPLGGYPNSPGDQHTPAPITRAANEGSSAKLRKERISRHGESGGYDDPGYGKSRGPA